MAKELILSVVVRKEQGRYSSWCPELDIASQGDTIEEAKDNLREAVELYVETMVSDGELPALLERIGLTSKDLQKEVLMPELFSGSLEIKISFPVPS